MDNGRNLVTKSLPTKVVLATGYLLLRFVVARGFAITVKCNGDVKGAESRESSGQSVGGGHNYPHRMSVRTRPQTQLLTTDSANLFH